MKPIKNVFPACEGSEKWYSVHRSKNVGRTKRRQSWKSVDKVPFMSAIWNRFDFVLKTHDRSPRDCSTMCNPGRGINITTDMCFPGRETNITRDMCFPGRGYDMCSPSLGNTLKYH